MAKRRTRTRELNREADRAYMAGWRAKNRHKTRAYSARYRLRKLGLTEEGYASLFDAQGRKCAICGDSNPPCAKPWHVDHCHETGKVRGILCQHCNHMLGHARDKQEVLLAAVDYLRR